MIHRKFGRRKFPTAMVAIARRTPALPPLAGAQLPRFLPLAANLLLGNFHQKWQLIHLSVSRLYLTCLLVPALKIGEIKREAHRDDQVQAATPHRPTIAIRRISVFPKREENKKHHGAGDENFVGGKNFHFFILGSSGLIAKRSLPRRARRFS